MKDIRMMKDIRNGKDMTVRDQAVLLFHVIG